MDAESDYDSEFHACPSCFQEHKGTGDYFKLCKCKEQPRLACKFHAEDLLSSRGDGYRIRNLICGTCKSKDDVEYECGSDDCNSSCSDKEVIDEDKKIKKSWQQQMEYFADRDCCLD